MKISKTAFKNYSRCTRYSSLADLQELKDYILDDDEKLNFSELLDDIENITQESIDASALAMAPYYKKIEVLAADYLKRTLGQEIEFAKETKDQKRFEIELGDYTYYCYVDAYSETEDTINIYEVKSTTSKKFTEFGKTTKCKPLFILENGVYKFVDDFEACGYTKNKYDQKVEKLTDKYSDVGKYMFDIAFQRFVIDQALKDSFKSINYFLVVLSSNYIYDGESVDYKQDHNGEELFTIIDANSITELYLPLINKMSAKVESSIETIAYQEVSVGKHCEKKKVTQCPFYEVCFKKVPKEQSVFAFIGSHFGFEINGVKYNEYDLINNNYFAIKDIPKESLKRMNNIIQYEVVVEGREHVLKDKIQFGMNQLKYPIYYLDFETFPAPLPRFYGERVYTQSVFQYSLHIDDGKSIIHKEFLATNELVDERLELVKQLVKDIPNDGLGSVVVYNESFEKSRIKELGVLFREYRDDLLAINDRMFDELHLLKGTKSFYAKYGYEEDDIDILNFYHKDLNGSYSIKKMLPIFTNLSYNDLSVGNGLEAVAAFSSLSQTSDMQTRQDLLAYCKQDTQSMIDVLDGLKKIL